MRFLLAISCFCLFFSKSFAQEIPEKPSPARFVNDYANLLEPSENQALEQKISVYNDSTSTQIVVVIITSLQGYTPEEYGIAIAEKWKIGQKEEDNGLIILLAMKEKAVRFEVGDGLEGIITDATSGRILREKMIPQFKKRNYYQGINLATDEVIYLLSGNFSPNEEVSSFSSWFWWVFIILVVVIIVALIVIIKMKTKV